MSIDQKQQQFDHSIDMNHLAIKHLAKDDHEAAIRYLSDAFKASRAALCGDAIQESTADSEHLLGFHAITTCEPTDDAIDSELIFRGAAFINPPKCQADRRHNVEIPAVLLFNLGLAYHLLSLRVSSRPAKSSMWGTTPSSSFLMEKAASLYQLASDLGRGQGLISMVALNNLIQIHRYRGDSTRTAYCIKILHSAIAKRMCTNDDPPSNLEMILRNIIDAMRQEAVVVAAAA